MVNSNIIGIITRQLEGRILEANDAFLRMVGYDREDLVAGRMLWTELTPPGWRDRAERAVAEAKMTGTATLEKEYFRKDGSRVPVLVGAATFEEGGNEGVAFVLHLTERKRAEEAARRSEKELRDVIETIPAMAWTALPDGTGDFVNKKWLEFTRMSSESKT